MSSKVARSILTLRFERLTKYFRPRRKPEAIQPAVEMPSEQIKIAFSNQTLTRNTMADTVSATFANLGVALGAMEKQMLAYLEVLKDTTKSAEDKNVASAGIVALNSDSTKAKDGGKKVAQANSTSLA